MRQKVIIALILIIAICFLIASVLVNYFFTGTLIPERIVASIFSLP